MGRLEQQEQAAEWFRDLFTSDWTKVILSTLIIFSVLPFEWVHTYSLVFFAIFAVELYGRFAVLRSDLRQREINRVEIAFFVIDVIALLSFLPIQFLWDDIRFLRLARLSRMLLLLGYWGPIVREIWTILSKRERRYQLFFAGASVLILSFLSAVLLFHFQSKGIDFNEDGDPGNDRFWEMLWWSFRQIQDPGNLVKDADASLGFFCSLALTLAGLFVFSFIIGIATSVVEQLVEVGRERRLGFKRHSVICNVGPYSRVLLEELVAYYAKSLRSPRIVTMGQAPTRYSYMFQAPLASAIRYRQGQALSAHDLQKVDADRATRVILLGQRDREASDSEVVSQVLSVRERNESCEIYAELFRGDNVAAALKAGGPRTVPILADRLVGLFMAQIVSFPGVEAVYGDLLTSRGDEIYTCLFDRGALAGRKPPSGPLPPFGELLLRCHRAHDVILLGPLVRDEEGRHGYAHRLNPAEDEIIDPASLRGFFGVAASFESLKDFVLSLPDVDAPRPPRERPPVPRFSVCPQACQVERLLICGFHEGLVDFCEQLILLSGSPEIYIMVPDHEAALRAVAAFVDRPALQLPADLTRRVSFAALDALELGYRAREGEAAGSIRFFVGDWTHERTLVEQPDAGYRLAEMDAVLFTYTLDDSDPDARTSLSLIKLLHLRESRPDAVRPNLRLVCEVQSTEKAGLLIKRFGRESRAADRSCYPISIVPAERMRNGLLAQGVFVPGIDLIYRELLSEAGQEVCKLVVTEPVDPAVTLSFGDLLATLYRRDRLIPVAVELLDGNGARRVVVNPRRRSDDYRFRAGDLVGVFAIGEYDDQPRASGACGGCKFVGRTPAP